MLSCFVSIPFGVKNRADGSSVDFNTVYDVIRQTVLEVEIECRRIDEFASGAIWHKELFSAIISSDLLISDITTDNANVFYELGIRHALSRGRTILISGGGRIPGNISYLRVLRYELDGYGRLIGDEAERFREGLKAAIR